MNLTEYKREINGIRQASLCFLVNEDNILLTMKKRGFGEGKWNGFGGKADLNEDIEACAIREAREEVSIEPINLKKAATMFYYYDTPNRDKNWEVTVFIIDKWEGLPDESEEVRPEWFNINDIPFEQMWSDDKYWLPRILNGEELRGEFLFDEKMEIIDFDIVHI